MSIMLGDMPYPYIFPSFPDVCSAPYSGSQWTLGLEFWYEDGVAYISVSQPTPWAVTGPHGQLASIIIM